MAVLAKPINKMTIIKEEDFKEFVREFNKNKASKEFLESCKKAGKLFGRRKQRLLQIAAEELPELP